MSRLNILCAILIFLFGNICLAPSSASTPPSGVWITGDVFTHGGVLFFRADKPVQGNRTGQVVLLGSSTQTMSTLMPLYIKAAERNTRLRLYGLLTPFTGTIPGHSEPLPSVQFITWKVHTPDDPDELPAGEKISVTPPATASAGTGARNGFELAELFLKAARDACRPPSQPNLRQLG